MQGREELLQELRALQTKCAELVDKIEHTQDEPAFERAKRDELYYLVIFLHGAACGGSEREDYCGIDDERFNNNNYFKTPERAAQVADKINHLLLLERLHDTFCPEYVPDWKSKEGKWSIYFDSYSNIYDYCVTLKSLNAQQAYFPTEEIAQKVCDILNKKLEEQA